MIRNVSLMDSGLKDGLPSLGLTFFCNLKKKMNHVFLKLCHLCNLLQNFIIPQHYLLVRSNEDYPALFSLLCVAEIGLIVKGND